MEEQEIREYNESDIPALLEEVEDNLATGRKLFSFELLVLLTEAVIFAYNVARWKCGETGPLIPIIILVVMGVLVIAMRGTFNTAICISRISGALDALSEIVSGKGED